MKHELIPTRDDLITYLTDDKIEIWLSLCAFIEERYEMERNFWKYEGKKWDLEYKYQRGGKTLCAFYAKQDCFGFMIIFGKKEREMFEKERHLFHTEIQMEYDNAKTFHDGKWMMFYPLDTSLFSDFERLVGYKRKPNRKS